MTFIKNKIDDRKISKLPPLNTSLVARKIDFISICILTISFFITIISSINFQNEIHKDRKSYFITMTGRTIPLSFTAKTTAAINNQLTVLKNEEKNYKK